MTERCTVPEIVKQSQGKAVCNPVFEAKYKDNSKCDLCPKANKRSILRKHTPTPPLVPFSIPNTVYED